MNIDEALTRLKDYMGNNTISYHTWLNSRHAELPTTPHRMILAGEVDLVINAIQKEITVEDDQEQSE